MTRRRNSLEGKVVLVTGPARGIGAEATRGLARRGARLSLVGLEPERLEALAAEVGPEAAWFEADVSDRRAVQAAVAGTVERFGGIDAVVANAGIGLVGAMSVAPPEDFDRVIAVNLLGTWNSVSAALPHLIERRGYVLHVASLAAALPTPLLGAYNASKAAVEAYAKTLRLEMEPHGVDVGVAYFSFADTEMVRPLHENPAQMRMRTALGEGQTKIVSLDSVAGAVVRGVERRARRVVAPRWIPLALWAREPVHLAMARRLRRGGALAEIMQLAEAPPAGARADRTD